MPEAFALAITSAGDIVEGWERTKCDLDCFWEGLGMFGGSSARPAQGGKQDGLLELRSSYGLAELLAELGQESRLVAHGESLDIVAPSTQGQEVIPSPPGGGYLAASDTFGAG